MALNFDICGRVQYWLGAADFSDGGQVKLVLAVGKTSVEPAGTTRISVTPR